MDGYDIDDRRHEVLKRDEGPGACAGRAPGGAARCIRKQRIWAKFTRLAEITSMRPSPDAGGATQRVRESSHTREPGRRTNEPSGSVRPVRLFEAVVESDLGEASSRKEDLPGW